MSEGAKHRLALLEKWEAKLSPAQQAVWATVMGMLPRESPLVGFAAGYGLEVFLMGHVMRNATAAQLVKYIPKSTRPVYDHRAAAAGDSEAA